MKPGEMMTITREEGATYSVVFGNLFADKLGPDEALASLAQVLFGGCDPAKPHFLWDAKSRIEWEKNLAKPLDEIPS